MALDPEVLDKIKKACSPQKAIYDMGEYMGRYDGAIIDATDTANKASQNASTALSTVNTVRVTADNALSTANQASATASNAASTASAAQTAATNAQTTADKAVSDAATALEAGNKGIADAANALAASNRVKTIADNALAGANAAVNGLDVTSDQSTVSVTATKNTGSPDVNALPVASAATAGVMNTATFLAVEGLNSRVAALENEVRTYLVTLPNTAPTQAEITTAYRTGYPFAPNPPLDGTVVIDAEKDLYYQWVGGSSQWIKLSGQQIGMFTNSTLGTIKGSTTEGQIAAEADGTGSLNGYDTLKSGVTANTTALETLTTRVDAVETKNTSQDTTINTNTTNISALTTRVTTAEGNISTAQTDITNLKNTMPDLIQNLTSNVTDSAVQIAGIKTNGEFSTVNISPVSASQAGVVTPEMYNQWNAGGGGGAESYYFEIANNGTAVIDENLSIKYEFNNQYGTHSYYLTVRKGDVSATVTTEGVNFAMNVRNYTPSGGPFEYKIYDSMNSGKFTLNITVWEPTSKKVVAVYLGIIGNTKINGSQTGIMTGFKIK